MKNLNSPWKSLQIVLFHALLLSQNNMKEVIIIYEKMLAKFNRLDLQISRLQKELQKFPPGKLICTHNKNYIKWFHSDGHIQTYIPKKKRAYAEQLAIKKYLSARLDD